jgi:Xaa-Pro aminopeptidase
MSGLSDDFKTKFHGLRQQAGQIPGTRPRPPCGRATVIAEGFDDPIEENMVFAVEPKKGIKDVGLVGVEDTYIITQSGAKCITGGGCVYH